MCQGSEKIPSIVAHLFALSCDTVELQNDVIAKYILYMSTSAMVTLQTGNKHTIGSYLQNLQQIPLSFDNLKKAILPW